MKVILIKIWNLLKLPYGLQIFAMRRINDQFLVGVTGVIFDDKDRILLVKHSYNRKGGTWGLPGGYLKGQEHPKEGLEREVAEETGFTISADQRIKIRTDRNSPRLDIVYMGKFISGDFSDSEEVLDAKFYNFEDLPALPKEQLFIIKKAKEEKEQADRQPSYVAEKKKEHPNPESKLTKIRSFLGM